MHFVVAGHMQLRTQGGEAVAVSAGEIVLLPHNNLHTFGSALNLASVPAGQCAWLAALSDTQVGCALAALHARPAEAWTTESLAREVGMSRSVFAERFNSLVGQPPMQYLTLWRMHTAAQRLCEAQGSVAQVVFAVGYESEAAFSRAFKREFGASPGTWRRSPK